MLNFFTAYRIEEGHEKGQMEVRMVEIAKVIACRLLPL
jgi:hypothetical protein